MVASIIPTPCYWFVCIAIGAVLFWGRMRQN